MKHAGGVFLARIRSWALLLALGALAVSCTETVKHDANLAGKRAVEFAQTVLIEKNFPKGYESMSSGGKRYITAEKLKETITRFHPRGFPTRVSALEFQPMPGEPAIWIYLTGHNPEEQFHYRITLEAGGGDYKVLTIDSGVIGRFFSPSSEKRSFPKPISTQP